MPIKVGEYHTEGKEHYIIRTPNPEWSGKRLGVTFVDGEGRTKYLTKMRRFAEEFGYDVILPKGSNPQSEEYKFTSQRKPTTREEYAAEEPIGVVREEEDEEEGQAESP